MSQRTKGRPLSKRVGRAAGVSLSTLAAVSMVAPMAFAQGNTGGGGVGGGGGTGGAGDLLGLWTLDDYGALPNPPQGWGQASIDYFYQLGYNANIRSSGYQQNVQDACSTALSQAIARNPGATRARVVQMGVSLRNAVSGNGTYEVSGGIIDNFLSMYENQWATQQNYLYGYPAAAKQAVHDEFLRQANAIASNTRVVCVALNDQEPADLPDYRLTITTDKRTTFTQAGGSAPVNDTIHASSTDPTESTVNGQIILNWDGQQNNPRSVTKNVSIRTNGDTISPNFTPADFGWTTWPAGRFWFDVRVPQQGNMDAAVDTPDRDPRETWTATGLPPSKEIMLPGTSTPFGSSVVLHAGQSYDAHRGPARSARSGSRSGLPQPSSQRRRGRDDEPVGGLGVI